MSQKDEVYQLLGQLATKFSAWEHNIGLMLDYLMGGVLTKALLIDRLPFSQKIDRCKKGAQYRFIEKPERLDEATALLKRVAAIRERRNLFVHGQWVILDELLPTVRVHTFKLRYNEQQKVWKYLVQERTSITKLRQELGKVTELVDDVVRFVVSVKDEFK